MGEDSFLEAAYEDRFYLPDDEGYDPYAYDEEGSNEDDAYAERTPD